VAEQLLWQGTDAHGFFEQWSYRFTGMISAAITALQDVAGQLAAEAEQQRSASDGPASYALLTFGLTVTALAADIGKLAAEAGKWQPGEKLTSLGMGEDPLGIVGAGAAGLDFVFNGTSFLSNLAADPHSPETLETGVDTALSGVAFGLGVAAVVAGAAVGPVVIGIGVAEGVNELASMIDPKFDEQVWSAGESSARIVASGVRGAASLLDHDALRLASVF
jgi:hypothetical protein